MSKISCCLRLGEVPLHLYQIIAGFIQLEKQGVIDLKIEKIKKNNKNYLPYNTMEVMVNHELRVLYDVNDGYDNLLAENVDFVPFMDRLLQEYDLCFKRSYSSTNNSKLKYAYKMFPLGLNYMVTIPGNIAHTPMPYDPMKEKWKKLIRMIPITEYYNGLYNVNTFEERPKLDGKPNILFMARLWDTSGDYEGQIHSAKQEERQYINDFRAQCIRLCRKEFGSQFFGGVSSSSFAMKNYPDLILEDKKITKRNHYLKKVKQSSICIATMGLHQSIGWKFSEYIAASKAIVTEKLHYEVPGNFVEGRNYLVFTTPEECVYQIDKLINNEALRYKMMVNNYKYYHEYVRPDRLVLNSLLTIMQIQDPIGKEETG